MSDVETMDVIVHKAINLAQGETLNQFTQALRMEARLHVMKKLNVPPVVAGKPTAAGAWMVEVFAKSVVMSVWKGNDPDRFFAFSFERNPKTLAFTFGDTVEVLRVSTFKPKPGISVTKSATVGVSKASTGDSSFAPVTVSVLKSADDNFWTPADARALGDVTAAPAPDKK